MGLGLVIVGKIWVRYGSDPCKENLQFCPLTRGITAHLLAIVYIADGHLLCDCHLIWLLDVCYLSQVAALYEKQARYCRR